MTRANHRRSTWIVAGSIAAHAGVLVLLALNAPELRMQAQPDEVFEVTVTPRYLPQEKTLEQPSRTVETRPLVPRRLLGPDEPRPVAPLVTPNAPGPAPATGLVDPRLTTPAAQPNALRRSAVGCANPALLSREERDACLDRLGAGAKTAPFIEPPMSSDKRSAFAEAAARKARMREYRAGAVPSGVTGSSAPGGITGQGEGPRLRDLGR